MNLYNNIMKKIYNENFIKYFIYIFVFIAFMGSNFGKISIGGINFNLIRLLMIFIPFLCLEEFLKEKKIKNYLNIKNKYIKICIIFFIIWSIYSMLSIFWIKDKYMYIVTNFNVVIGTFCIIYFSKNLNNIEIFENIFKIAIFSVTINCIYYIIVRNTYIGGFYHNTNDLATVLLFVLPSNIYFIYKDLENNKKLIFRILQYIICIITFFFINSRGCMLGVALGVGGIIFNIFIKNKKKILKNKRNIIIGLILIFISITFSIYFLSNFLSNIRLKPVRLATNSNQVRINLIYNAIEFLKQDLNFIKGIGAGNSIYYYQNYSIYTVHEIYSPHNLWIQVLLEYGIIIFIFFVLTWILIIMNLLKNKNKINNIFIFFMFAMLIACISSSTLLTREYFWIIIAIIIAWCNQLERNENK